MPRQLREWSMPRGREWIRFRFPCPANAGFRGFRGWRGEEAYLYKSVFRGTSPLAAALGAVARGWQAPPGGGIGRWIEMSVKCA